MQRGSQKRRPPRPGVVFCSRCVSFALPSYRPHFWARCGRPHGSVVLLFRIKNRSAPLDRSGPLPPGASSIDLKDSEQFVQPDHDTSSDVGAGSFCSVPRNTPVLHPRMGGASRGQGYGYFLVAVIGYFRRAGFGRSGRTSSISGERAEDRGSGAERSSRRATMTHRHRRRRRPRPRSTAPRRCGGPKGGRSPA